MKLSISLFMFFTILITNTFGQTNVFKMYCAKQNKNVFTHGNITANRDSIITFLSNNDFTSINTNGDSISAKRKFKTYDSDSISYNIIYDFNRLKFKINNVEVISENYNTLCDITNSNNHDYIILTEHRIDHDFWDLHFPNKSTTDKKSLPRITVKNIISGRIIILNDSCIGLENIKQNNECIDSTIIINKRWARKIAELFNQESYDIDSWGHHYEIYFELIDIDENIIYNIGYSLSGNHTIISHSQTSKVGSIIKDKALDKLDRYLLKSGYPKVTYNQIQKSRKEERNSFKKLDYEANKDYQAHYKKIKSLSKTH